MIYTNHNSHIIWHQLKKGAIIVLDKKGSSQL